MDFEKRKRNNEEECSESSYCEHQGTKCIYFVDNGGERKICRGKSRGYSDMGSVVYIGLDMTTGEYFTIAEWSIGSGIMRGGLDITENNESTEVETEVQHWMKQIEEEMNHLNTLHHNNLVHYINMKYIQEKDSVVIYVLQEFVTGITCAFYLTQNNPVDVDTLRHIATGVLSALQYLHQNNVVHKDLRDTSVHLDSAGVVKLSGYSLDKKLSDIYSASCLARTEHDSPTIQGREGKKSDIYGFGALLLSLLKDIAILDSGIDLASNLQADLRDFLSKCLILDESKRWSAEQLLQHCFIRVPIGRGLSLPCWLDRKKEQNSSEPEEPVSDDHLYLTALGGQSRIQNEFEVLEWLGKGASGDVLKVKHKLDGGVYAVKRIKLNPKNTQLNRKITREVKLLSRLYHKNVVRYYNSWIESVTLDDPSHRSQLTPAATPSSGVATGTENAEDFPPSTQIDSSDSIVFKKTSASQTSSFFQETGELSQRKPDKDMFFMYIHMEFCEKSTLRTAIDNGLCKEEERVWRLFRELVEGVAHIHQRSMIHRDLKPVNIFLDSNDHVKIGDFGLATKKIIRSPLAQTIDTDKELQLIGGTSFDREDIGSLTGQVGTALYTAPELSSKVAKATYNQKVDIYSLGIIFFEMWYRPLNTGMERAKVLLNLKSKEIIFPQEFTDIDMPHQVHLLRWLLNHDPRLRPTAQTLLTSQYLRPPQFKEAEMQEMVRHSV